MLQDLRFVARSLARNPLFSGACALTLALGIGANVAIFSLLDGVLLEPLPYRDSERIVLLQQSAPLADRGSVAFSIKEVLDYRAANRSFSDLVEHHGMTFTLLGQGDPQRVSTGVVSSDFFSALGVAPLHGRTFLPGDDDLGAEAVLVLSWDYWQRAFSGDESVVGRVFEMNNRPHTVVGVLPPIPQYPQQHDVYMSTSACPFRANAERQIESNRSSFRALTAFGRLEPGATLESAQDDFGALAARFAAEFPDTYPPEAGFRVDIVPLREELVRAARPTLIALFIATGLVLLLAFASVANLQLSRLFRRERELAVRAALGAGRAGLVRLGLLEGLALSLVGGALGVGLAYGGLELLRRFLARFTSRAVEVDIDGVVLLFALGLSLLVALGMAVLYAAGTSRGLSSALRQGSKGSAGGGRERLRGGLIAVQVALAVLLLVGAGLMIKTLGRLQAVDVGFDTERVLTARLTLNWTRYQATADALTFWGTLLDRVETVPGIEAAGLSLRTPLDGLPPFTTGLRIEGEVLEEDQLAPQVSQRSASEGLFELLHVPILAGRDFTRGDDAEAPPVAIVNQTFVAQLLGGDGEGAVGRRVSLNGGQSWLEVVGVAGDVRRALDTPPESEIYRPVRQSGAGQMLFVRSQRPRAELERDIRDIVRAIDPEQPIDNFQTLDELRNASTATPRTTAALLALFAAAALAITITGVAGLVAFSVSQRLQEIGIRLALGASRSSIVAMVIRTGVALGALGLVVGAAGALLFGRAFRHLLFEVSPHDASTFGLVALVVLGATLLASVVPALRSTRVSPTVALRQD